MQVIAFLTILAVCHIAAGKGKDSSSLRRDLAGLSAPNGWLLTVEYLDSACTKPTGYQTVGGGGECVQNYASGSPTGTSYSWTGTTSSTVLTSIKTSYSDAACTTNPVAGTPLTQTINTCVQKSGDSEVWQYKTTVSAAPTIAAGAIYTVYYQTAALCGSSATSAYTSADIITLPNTCVKTKQSESLVVTYVSGATSASTQYYSDNSCTTKSGSPVVINFSPTCIANPKMSSLTSPSTDNSMAFATNGLGTAATPAAASESASASSCFAASETVQLQDGSVKALSQLRLGDMVLTASMDGAVKGFSPVIAVPHATEAQTDATFVQLYTASDMDVKMTVDHLVLAGSCAASAPLALMQARSVSVGDCLQTAAGKTAVTAVKTVQGKGLSSAVTLAGGLIVVNGIVASPFAVNHRIGEAWYVIHRALHTVLPVALGWSLFQKTSEKFGDLAVQASL